MKRRLVNLALLAGVLAVVPFFVPNSYIFDVVIRIGLTAATNLS